jgi:hypothetical protein
MLDVLWQIVISVGIFLLGRSQLESGVRSLADLRMKRLFKSLDAANLIWNSPETEDRKR